MSRQGAADLKTFALIKELVVLTWRNNGAIFLQRTIDTNWPYSFWSDVSTFLFEDFTQGHCSVTMGTSRHKKSIPTKA